MRRAVQVEFLYSRVGLDGQLSHDGRVRKAHPLAMLCAQGQYYLLACYDGSTEVRHFRIDHIMTSPNLEVYNCEVDRSIKASDHYPIWCYIRKK